jgi:hypothetical protein
MPSGSRTAVRLRGEGVKLGWGFVFVTIAIGPQSEEGVLLVLRIELRVIVQDSSPSSCWTPSWAQGFERVEEGEAGGQGGATSMRTRNALLREAWVKLSSHQDEGDTTARSRIMPEIRPMQGGELWGGVRQEAGPRHLR